MSVTCGLQLHVLWRPGTRVRASCSLHGRLFSNADLRTCDTRFFIDIAPMVCGDKDPLRFRFDDHFRRDRFEERFSSGTALDCWLAVVLLVCGFLICPHAFLHDELLSDPQKSPPIISDNFRISNICKSSTCSCRGG